MSPLRAAAWALAALLAVAAVAAPATAERPDAPPGEARQGEGGSTHGPGSQGHGNGNGQGQGQGRGSSAGDTSATQEPAPADDTDGSTPPADASDASSKDPSLAQDDGSDPRASASGEGSEGETAQERPAPSGRGAPASARDERPVRGRAADPTGQADPVGQAPVPREDVPVGALAPSVPALRLHDAGTPAVTVGDAGAIVSWTLPEGASQVQVWRQDGDAWTPVGQATSDGSLTDPAGDASSTYRMTWTSTLVDAGQLTAAASALPLVPAGADGSSVGAWLLGLLAASALAFATVRAPGPRAVPEARVSPEHQLLPTLAGHPGIDHEALERVVQLGLRTVGQLRAIDPEALAFWAKVPVGTVRLWHDAIDLLQWPALPVGAAHRLARAGAGTLAAVAAADPDRLWDDLREGVGAAGPGLPSDKPELASWVAEARQALGGMASGRTRWALDRVPA